MKNRSEKIIKKLIEYYGYPKTELSYTNLYELIIAVILSAQTTDRQVNSVTPILFCRFNDFKSLSRASYYEVENIIKRIGLYKNKTKNIITLSNEIISNHNGKVPKNFEELVKLPGIGRKSANVILSIGFDKPAFAVDTHILRIANRMGYIKSKNPYEVEKAITSVVLRKDWKVAHLLFIRHGRDICKARKPLCVECPVSLFCNEVNKIV